jgi:hypothetical protein
VYVQKWPRKRSQRYSKKPYGTGGRETRKGAKPRVSIEALNDVGGTRGEYHGNRKDGKRSGERTGHTGNVISHERREYENGAGGGVRKANPDTELPRREPPRLSDRESLDERQCGTATAERECADCQKTEYQLDDLRHGPALSLRERRQRQRRQ